MNKIVCVQQSHLSIRDMSRGPKCSYCSFFGLLREDSLSTRDEMAGPRCVLYSEVPPYVLIVVPIQELQTLSIIYSLVPRHSVKIHFFLYGEFTDLWCVQGHWQQVQTESEESYLQPR